MNQNNFVLKSILRLAYEDIYRKYSKKKAPLLSYL